jgi:hypothetical protein
MSCTPDNESMEETDACFIVRERQRAGARATGLPLTCKWSCCQAIFRAFSRDAHSRGGM